MVYEVEVIYVLRVSWLCSVSSCRYPNLSPLLYMWPKLNNISNFLVCELFRTYLKLFFFELKVDPLKVVKGKNNTFEQVQRSLSFIVNHHIG